MREHRDGAVAMVAKVRGMYLAYTERNSTVTTFVDTATLEAAQAAADRAAGCSQPCGCPSWDAVSPPTTTMRRHR